MDFISPMKILVCRISILCMLGGCAVIESTSHTQTATEYVFQQTVPTCSGAKECEVKWSAARRFVVANSRWKIQTLTSDYLETFNSTNGDPGLAWRVSREPSADGQSYRIVPLAACANMFGCVPDAMQTMIRFNEEVTASWRPAP